MNVVRLQPLQSMWRTLGKMRHPDVRSEAVGLAVVFLSLPSFISSGCDTAFLTSFFSPLFPSGSCELDCFSSSFPCPFQEPRRFTLMLGPILTLQPEQQNYSVRFLCSVVISPYRQSSSSTVNAEMNYPLRRYCFYPSAIPRPTERLFKSARFGFSICMDLEPITPASSMDLWNFFWLFQLVDRR